MTYFKSPSSNSLHTYSETTPFLSDNTSTTPQQHYFRTAIHHQLQHWLPTNAFNTDNYPKNMSLFQPPSYQDNDALLPDEQHLLPGSYDDRTTELQEYTIAPQPPPGLFSSISKFIKLLPPKDTIWAVLFILSLSMMIFITMGLWFTPNAPPNNNPNQIITNPISVAIKDSIPILLTTLCISSMLGALWILLIGAYVRPVVWTTIMFIPTACLGVCSWSMYLIINPKPSSQTPQHQVGYLIMIVITTFVSSLSISVLAFAKRNQIRTSIHVIEMATHIIRSNAYSIFGLSFGLLAVMVAYLCLYVGTLHQFIKLFDLGTWVSMGFGYSSTLILFTMVMVWSTVTITSIYQLTISSIVHYWYFCRQRPKPLSQQELGKRALKRSCTTLLGTACLGGLVQSIIHFIQLGHYWFNQQRRQIMSQRTTTRGICESLIQFLTKWIQYMNHYTMAYSAITGHSFFQSAKHTNQLLNQHAGVNHIMIQDLFIQAIFILGNFILCTVVGLSLVTVLRSESFIGMDENNMPTTTSSITGVLFVSMWICFAVMRFWGLVLSYVIDATYLCYVIDLDNASNHFDLAHLTFNKENHIMHQHGSDLDL